MKIGLGIGVTQPQNMPMASVGSPSYLFRDGTQGTWYDPSDTTTLYRDAAGTLPVTAVEQPVGLMLDKSKGLVLGSELVTNGDFSNGTTGWSAYNSASLSVNNGMLRVTNTAAAYGGCYQAVTTTVGKWYKFSVAFQKQTATTVYFSLRQTSSDASHTIQIPSTDTSGVINFYWYSTYATAYVNVQVNNANGVYADFDNISVRELPGNHAFNSSGNSANFPVLSARYNLLTKTEDFSDAVWTKQGSPVITPDTTVAPDGSLTADTLAISPSNYVYQSINITAGVTYTLSCWVKVASGVNQFKLNAYGSGNNFTSDVKTATTNWQQFSFTFTSIASGATNLYAAIVDGLTGGNFYIWGADLRVANDALNQPAYQRVNTSTDYDTSGFKPYLKFNGTNQWLQTNSIDFSYGDKMFVCAGVRKLSDVATGILLETSNAFDTTSGVISIAAPIDVGYKYGVTVRGTVVSAAPTTDSQYASPITNVLSGIGNISGDQAILRVNGVQAAISTADQGTGNYGNYPLYIGARAGSSLWFNGRIYQLVVAGKQVPELSIQLTEKYLNDKTAALDWRDVTDSSSFRWNSATASPDAS